jgi:hypothetical protein
VKNVVATLDLADAPGQIAVSTDQDKCSSKYEVEVHTYSSTGAAANKGFFVALN